MDDRRDLHAPVDNPEVLHETSDIDVRALGKFALGFLIVTIAVFVILYFMFEWMTHRSEVRDPDPISLVDPGTVRRPPEPNLQRLNTAPAIEIDKMRTEEDLNLGIAEGHPPAQGRISIEQAIRLTAERGLPVQPSAEATGLMPADSGALSGQPPSPRIAPGFETGYPPAEPDAGRNEEVRPRVPSTPRETPLGTPRGEPQAAEQPGGER